MIDELSRRYGRSVARWDLVDAAGGVVLPGISFGVVSDDGRFLGLNGFFGGIEELLR
jgi:hypothetical protein